MKQKLTAKELFRILSIPVVVASLCCLSPIVFVLLGISTTAVAASLSDILYYEYRWYFRLAGLLALSLSLWLFFRKKGICTLDEAKRRRNEIINTALLVLIVSILAYIVWLYGVVEIIGIWLGIWG